MIRDSIFFVILLFLTADLYAGGYKRSPYLLRSVAGSVISDVLFHAVNNDGRLPDELEEIEDYDRLIPEEMLENVFYIAPQNATIDLPSRTPVVLVTSVDRESICIGFMDGDVQCFRRTPHAGRPEPFYTELWRENPLFVISVGLNVILIVVLADSLLFSRRSGRIEQPVDRGEV